MPAGNPFEALAASLECAEVWDQLGALQAVENLQLCAQSRLIGAAGGVDHHTAFGAALQGIEGPEQGAGLEQEYPVMPLPRGISPELLAEAIEAFPFAAGLPLNPALELGVIRTAAEHLAQLLLMLNGRGELGGTSLLQPLAALPFPTQGSGMPEDLPLEIAG